MRTISIVICTYNRATVLKQLLRDLTDVDFDMGKDAEVIELVVIDNNSHDETRTVVAEGAEALPFPVNYYLEKRQGIPFARNRGVTEAKGDFLICLDDDVVPDKQLVKRTMETFERYDADCVSGKILPLWAHEPPAWLVENKTLATHYGLIDEKDGLIVCEGAENYDPRLVHGANMSFRKSVFETVGLFDTALGTRPGEILRGEESQMSERILQAGKRVIYDPEVIVYHRIEADRMRMKYFRDLRYGAGRTQVLMYPGKYPILAKWLLKECLMSAVKLSLAYLRFSRKDGIKHELQFWFQLGVIVQILKRSRGS